MLPANGPTLLPPPHWSSEALQAERDRAQQQFIVERRGEGAATFYAVWEEVEPLIRAALDGTSNLRQLEGHALLADQKLWQTLRYVCAPRISEEDLWTLVGKKFKNVPAAFAATTAETFASLVDTKRFPWVVAERDPTDAELHAAVLATVTLLAHETLSTKRRGNSSKSQEAQVSAALVAAGFVLDLSRKSVDVLDQIPRGHFSRERKVGGAKCDVPIRLHDGRLLALECKVSNGPKNSWKRLQREVGGKSDAWKHVFGAQVLTGAVLAGVFDLKCLMDAQESQHVLLFWQHDLKQLIDFVGPVAPA